MPDVTNLLSGHFCIGGRCCNWAGASRKRGRWLRAELPLLALMLIPSLNLHIHFDSRAGQTKFRQWYIRLFLRPSHRSEKMYGMLL